MAAPRETPRESVRIRIKLDINKIRTKTVSRKYWMLVQESPTLSTISDLQLQIIDRFHLITNSIQLCLEHFYLPSWESVRILRENDLLSVQDIDAIKTEAHNQCTPKSCENTEEGKIPDLQSCMDEEMAVEQTTQRKKKKKRKRQHSQSDDIAVDFQEVKSLDGDTQVLKIDKMTMKQKVRCLNGTGIEVEEKRDKESVSQQRNAIQTVTEQVPELGVKRECEKVMLMDPLKQCNGGADGGVEDVIGDSATKTKKKRRRRHKPRRGQVDTQSDVDNTLNLTPPQVMLQTPVLFLPAENAQKGHVHFDSDKSEDEAKLVGGTISNNSNCNDVKNSHLLAAQVSDSQSSGTVVKTNVNGKTGAKVFYRGKPSSVAPPSSDIAATALKSTASLNVVIQVKEKDYSVYDLLHGPPRSGDKIAYKLLELSETYNPEVSSYKEALVISYDPATQTLEVEKLGAPIAERKPGKFDLVVEDDNEILTTTKEDILKASLSWPALIEPRLIT